MNVANSVLWRMAIILKANKVTLFVCFVCFLVPFTELLRHTSYNACLSCFQDTKAVYVISGREKLQSIRLTFHP
jgi:hypothetical protein